MGTDLDRHAVLRKEGPAESSPRAAAGNGLKLAVDKKKMKSHEAT